VAGYSGDAGDALLAAKWTNWIASGMMFTTLDSDNDIHLSTNCAGTTGGWWYKKCGTSVVNRDANGVWVTGNPVNDVQSSRILLKLKLN